MADYVDYVHEVNKALECIDVPSGCSKTDSEQ